MLVGEDSCRPRNRARLDEPPPTPPPPLPRKLPGPCNRPGAAAPAARAYPAHSHQGLLGNAGAVRRIMGRDRRPARQRSRPGARRVRSPGSDSRRADRGRRSACRPAGAGIQAPPASRKAPCCGRGGRHDPVHIERGLDAFHEHVHFHQHVAISIAGHPGGTPGDNDHHRSANANARARRRPGTDTDTGRHRSELRPRARRRRLRC